MSKNPIALDESSRLLSETLPGHMTDTDPDVPTNTNTTTTNTATATDMSTKIDNFNNLDELSKNAALPIYTSIKSSKSTLDDKSIAFCISYLIHDYCDDNSLDFNAIKKDVGSGHYATTPDEVRNMYNNLGELIASKGDNFKSSKDSRRKKIEQNFKQSASKFKKVLSNNKEVINKDYGKEFGQLATMSIRDSIEVLSKMSKLDFSDTLGVNVMGSGGSDDISPNAYLGLTGQSTVISKYEELISNQGLYPEPTKYAQKLSLIYVAAATASIKERADHLQDGVLASYDKDGNNTSAAGRASVRITQTTKGIVDKFYLSKSGFKQMYRDIMAIAYSDNDELLNLKAALSEMGTRSETLGGPGMSLKILGGTGLVILSLMTLGAIGGAAAGSGGVLAGGSAETALLATSAYFSGTVGVAAKWGITVAIGKSGFGTTMAALCSIAIGLVGVTLIANELGEASKEIPPGVTKLIMSVDSEQKDPTRTGVGKSIGSGLGELSGFLSRSRFFGDLGYLRQNLVHSLDKLAYNSKMDKNAMLASLFFGYENIYDDNINLLDDNSIVTAYGDYGAAAFFELVNSDIIGDASLVNDIEGGNNESGFPPLGEEQAKKAVSSDKLKDLASKFGVGLNINVLNESSNYKKDLSRLIRGLKSVEGVALSEDKVLITQTQFKRLLKKL